MSLIIALDTETGGTDPEKHAPVSLAVAAMDGEDVLGSRHWIFADQSQNEKAHLRRDYNVGALRVSGVTWKQIQEGTPPPVVLQELRAWAVEMGADINTPIVSHNAVFDQGFLSDLLFRCGGFDYTLKRFVHCRCPLAGPWVCTQRLASFLDGQPGLKLNDVAGRFGLTQPEPHCALDDAILAGRIYSRLTGTSESKRGAA